MVEQKGLGAGVHEAFVTDKFTIRAMNIKFNAAKGRPELTKTIDMLTPEIKKLYLEIKKNLETDDNEAFFINTLVNKDTKSPKEGYLAMREIGLTLQSVDNDLSTQELNQVTGVLSTNFDTDYSYVEMISILFGTEKMRQVMRDNNIK
jgi:hypothetical protein